MVGSHLRRLESDLKANGFGGELLVVQSNGGVMSRQTACDVPVRTALSGPAAGVIACAAIARAAGFPDVVSGDMGGTSFDVSLVAGGEAALSAQTSIDFGMVVRAPMIQIETIGAGGGSIASVDAGGLLQVGPESAGSVPGPACYGGGYSRPTVTDANVLLGRIAAERPLGGGLLARWTWNWRAAIEEHVARPLGLDAHAAAEAILTVANAKMAGAIRLVSIERGHDPRKFAYMPFGGGGALHVCAMMYEVDAARGIVPRYPGVTSALGCVMADMRHDGVQTLNVALDAWTPATCWPASTAWRRPARNAWIPPAWPSRASARASNWTCCTWARATRCASRSAAANWTGRASPPRSSAPTAPPSAAASPAFPSGS